MGRVRVFGTLCIAAAGGLCSPANARPEPYMRLGAGVASGEHFALRDANCNASAPPALFGCGAGIDGAPHEAKVDGGSSAVFDLAIGARLVPAVRGEVLVNLAGRREMVGNANFLRSGPVQPVTGSVRSLSVMAALYWDLPKLGPVQPFVGGGLGMASHRVSAIRFDFPTLGPTAATITPPGRSTDLAAMATAGAAVALSDRLSVELAYRFSDLGRLRTSAGEALIIRNSGSRSILIASTQGRLRTQGAMLALRRTF